MRIRYLRAVKSDNPAGCIAYAVSPDKTKIFYQVSVVAPPDQFSRKIAREIAIGRLKTNPAIIEMNPGSSATMSIMEHLRSNKDVPGRARKVARHWIINAYSNKPEKTLKQLIEEDKRFDAFADFLKSKGVNSKMTDEQINLYIDEFKTLQS